MQVNCSITHTLNQSATNEELSQLVCLMEQNFFRPNQAKLLASYISRQSIQNYLEEHCGGFNDHSPMFKEQRYGELR